VIFHRNRTDQEGTPVLTIRKLTGGELTEVTIYPVGYQASEDELAAMYAALFAGETD
jgi:hypothetical protein